jgi:hypothetical protein
MAELLLQGQKVVPEKIVSCGYNFKFSHFKYALKDIFTKKLKVLIRFLYKIYFFQLFLSNIFLLISI